jgi:EmrB/QacA subfamily drug resistance transporter
VTETTTRRAARGVLAASCISTLVVNANTSAVSILLPSISADTGMPVDTLQLAVTGYSLVGAAVIVTSGALGDVFGRRRIFIGGLVLFVLSCIFIALSTGGWGVIVGRMIQGAAGSTILACGLSLLSVATTGKEQLRAVSYWGAAAAIGAALGPLVGGFLVTVSGWQGLFWLDAIIAAAIIPLTLLTVKESRDPGRSRSIDYLGSFLVALTLAPVILALSMGSNWGWTSFATIGCFVLSVVAGVAFVFVERRLKAPLIDLAMLKNSLLVGATVAILIGAGTINGLMYLLSLYFQEDSTLGFSAFEAGLATLPATVGLVIIAALVPRLAARFGSRLVIAAGFAITAIGFAAIGFVQSDWRYGVFVLPLLAIAAGMGMSNGPATSVSTASVPADEVGSASGISNMARYIGAAVATAIAASIYGSVSANRVAEGAAQADALASGLAVASWVMAIFSALGILLAVLVARHRPTERTGGFEAAASSAAAIAHTVPVADQSEKKEQRSQAL